MSIKQIMTKKKLNTTGYVPNVKRLPLLDDSSAIIIDKSAVDTFNDIKKGVKINNYNGVEKETYFVLVGYQTSYGIVYIKECILLNEAFNVNNGQDFKFWDLLDKSANSASQFKRGEAIIFLGHTNSAKYTIDSEGKKVQQESSNCWSSEDLLSTYEYSTHYKVCKR